MNAEDITKALFWYYKNYNYRIANVFIYDWESDFYCLSKSGYSVEVEIKITVGDFKADFKKKWKHLLLSSKTSTVFRRLRWNIITYDRAKKTPNRFYYACPEGMIKVDDIPEYAGLIYVGKYRQITIVKNAPLLHPVKNDMSQKLLAKFYWAYVNLRLND